VVWPLKNDNSLEFFVVDREANFEMFFHLTRLLRGDPLFPGSIFEGSKSFIGSVKSILGGLFKGRKIKENRDGYQLGGFSIPMGEF